MIEAVQEWLRAVVVTALLLSVVQTLLPEGNVRRIASFSGGLILMLVLLRPLLGTDLSALELDLAPYREAIEERQAELEARTKVSDSEVLYAAKEKARQIIAHAEERSRLLYQVANEYAEDALARTEEAVQAALDEVKQQRVRFRTASAEQMQEQRAKLEQKAIQSDDDV